MGIQKDLSLIVGEAFVWVDEQEMKPYLTDWRKRLSGRAKAVVAPANETELAEVVRYCQRYDIPMVPQGGNTGLCGGATPSNRGDAVLILTRRFDQILEVDVVNETMTVQAGCTLQTVQEVAQAHGKLFPLSLASEGSCTIGGNVATNAGGTQVLRYGTMRDLVLGIRAVMPDGDVYDDLHGLRKDNTGYRIKDLLVGSEGTLGIITAVTLKLYPLPVAKRTALLALPSLSAALDLLHYCKQHLASGLTAFELMSHACVQAVRSVFPNYQSILTSSHASDSPWFVLLELSDFESEAHAYERLESVLAQAFDLAYISDAIIAQSLQQSKELWGLREHIPLAEVQCFGKAVKNDISLPISQIATFVQETNYLLQLAYPHCQMVIFGHLGDGNLHYNVAPALGDDMQDFLSHQDHIFKIVMDSVDRFGGSISAEHGIGSLKRDYLSLYKSENELFMMRKIKRAFDPYHLMNPGKVISELA